jgi:hypothetical protein
METALDTLLEQTRVVLVLAEEGKYAARVDGSAYQFAPFVVERDGIARDGGILLQSRLPNASNEELVRRFSVRGVNGCIQRYSSTGQALRCLRGAREIKPLYPVNGMSRTGRERGSTRNPWPSMISYS